MVLVLISLAGCIAVLFERPIFSAVGAVSIVDDLMCLQILKSVGNVKSTLDRTYPTLRIVQFVGFGYAISAVLVVLVFTRL
jgi:hypothetical protein